DNPRLTGLVYSRNCLPDIKVYDLYRDRAGYMWVAGDLGLFKYDGKQFREYTSPVKRGLSVFQISEDEEGRIWCYNITGQILYVENDSLKVFIDEKIFGNNLSFLQKTDDRVLITIPGEHKIYNFQNKSLIKSIRRSYEEGPLFYRDGLHYFLSGSLLKYLDKCNQITDLVKTPLPQNRRSLNYFNTDDNLFIYWRNKEQNLIKIDLEANSPSIVKIPPILMDLNWSKTVLMDDYIWICTNDGTFKCHIAGDQLIVEDCFLKNESTTDIEKDINGNLWIATINNSVFVIPNLGITRYNLPDDYSNLLSATPYNREILMGSFSGAIGVFDIQKKKIRTLYKLKSKINKLLFLADQKKIVAGLDGMLLAYDSEKNELFTDKHIGSVKDIAASEGKEILIALHNMSLKIKIEQPEFAIEGIAGGRSNAVYFDKATKKIYLGTSTDFISFDENLNSTIITKQNDDHIFAIDITKTDNGIIWLSTNDGGIYGVENDQIVKQYNTTSGLPSNQTSVLLAVDDLLWASTTKGIARINVVTDEIEVITKQDGLPTYRVAEMISMDGEIFCLSNKGLFKIDPETVFKTLPAPDFLIREITMNEIPVNLIDQNHFNYDQNNLSITLAANGFQTEKSLVFEYKINDSDYWKILNKGEDRLTLFNLASGEYVIKMRVRDIFRNTQSSTQQISFSIGLPFYRTIWFLSLVSVAAILVGLIIIRVIYERKQIESQKAYDQLVYEKELTSLRLENLRSRMDPHFIFNAFNSIQDYILRNRKEEASNYLGQFADLVREYLQNSSEDRIAFDKEIENIERYLELEKLRFEENFNYSITIDEELTDMDFFIPTMIIQPYLENAIKHGLLHKSGLKMLQIYFSRIKIDTEKEQSIVYLECTIRDNGIGRVESEKINRSQLKKHKSFAQKATQERLTLLNKNRTHVVSVMIKDMFDTAGQGI
ncbi:MAG: histidine kinase, partial [Bacteroidota bacterium]